MTLAYLEQYRLAEKQPDIQKEISAGSFASAVTAFGKTPLADQKAQAQRLALANALMIDPSYAARTFSWVVVSRPTVNTEADLTDAFIKSTIDAQFDTIAAQLFINVG